MKRFLTLAAALVVAASLATAGPLACAVATLSTYDVAGFQCIESVLDFSSFHYSASGTVSPLPTDVSVEVTPLFDGFDFQAPFSAPAGTNLDVRIEYIVSDPGGITGDELSIAGFGATGTGALDLAETICPGAVFTCATPLASLNVLANSTSSNPTASAVFASPQSVIGIVKDLSITGGSGLSGASVSLIDNATPFAAPPVPEPTTMGLIGAGLLALVLPRRRRQ